IIGAMTEVDDAAKIGHPLEDAGWRQIEIERGHPDLSLVADIGPDPEVEPWNRRRHLSPPQICIFQLADEGEGHESSQFSAGPTAAGAAATSTTNQPPTRITAPPMRTRAVSASPSARAPVITPAIGMSRMNGVTWSTRYFPSTWYHAE